MILVKQLAQSTHSKPLMFAIYYLLFKLIIIIIIIQSESRVRQPQEPINPSEMCFLGVTYTLQRGKNNELGICKDWFLVLALLPPSCTTFGKSLNLSDP